MSEEREVIIRFGMTTPYWPLSMTYGVFYEPLLRTWFVSLDHWIGFHMFDNPEHQREVLNSPNGWIAMKNTQRILNLSNGLAIRSDWAEQRDIVMERGLRLKFGQNVAMRDLLISTRSRRLLDESRIEDEYWCNANGRGQNRHANLLENVRRLVHDGVSLEHAGA